MSRQEAEKLVRERWARLGLGKPSDFPNVFGMDVENALEWAQKETAISKAEEGKS